MTFNLREGDDRGRMVLNLMRSAVQWHREAIGERTRDALTAKRHRGERTSRHAPYGWTVATDGKTLTTDPDETDMMLFALETREALGCTWLDTAAALNREGYQQRNGQPWTLHNIRSALRVFKRDRQARLTERR